MRTITTLSKKTPHLFSQKILRSSGIVLLWGLLLGAVLWPIASPSAIEIKADLDHKVQHIEQMVFTTGAIKGESGLTPPSAIISAQNYNPVISGNLFLELQGQGNTLYKKADHAALFYGTRNEVHGNEAVTIVGDKNKISNNTTGVVILWGNNHIINPNSEKSVIAGGDAGSIQWSTNFIGVWKQNQISWTWNVTIWGQKTTVKGENNFVAGANINFDPQNKWTTRRNTFVWSDNKVRPNATKILTPAKDGVFLIRAEKGLAIGVPTTSIPGSVEVNGMVQLGNDTEACTKDKVWAIKYIDEKPSGCFCACDNGAGLRKWSALSPSPYCESKCRG